MPSPTLTRDQTRRALRREERPPRPPLFLHKWFEPDFEESLGPEDREAIARCPDDVEPLFLGVLPWKKMGLSWGGAELAEGDVLNDWGRLDELIEKLPDPAADDSFTRRLAAAREARARNRYILFGWWNCFFEHASQLRGAQNLMMDPYMAPAELGRLLEALGAHYRRYIERALELLEPDGFFTSDDVAQQSGLMVAPELFREHFLPHYETLGSFLKEKNLDWWLHSCGDNRTLLEDYARVGVDLLHPVQKGPLDYAEVAQALGGRMSFLVGIDQLGVLREGFPEAVRREVATIRESFERAEGGLLLGLGNEVVAGTPVENYLAFLEAATG